MEHGFFYQALVYLSAAVISVPVAKRLGLGSVLGYLIAGVLIGPYVLKLIGEEGEDAMHFAEFGVVMMLFLIGLELQPPLLWKMRASIFGLGGFQVAATALVVGAIATALGLTWKMGLACGLILAMSSTAIVLQTLNERSLLKTPGGQATFAVLLFQDIAVIPILALLPLLAFEASSHVMPGVAPGRQALFTLGAITAIVLAGRYTLRPVFRFIAATKLRELFTATALLLVVGIAMLMQKVGLSPALGAFLGGVVMANSEYRHELESDIEPFKGLLLGLFFISVGASIDFHLVAAHPAQIAGLVGLLLIVKCAILFLLGRLFGLKGPANLLFALGLAQCGEFAFVLFSFAAQGRILTPAITGSLVAVVALSMAVAPLLFIAYESIAARWMSNAKDERASDAIDDDGHAVIIAGFGRFGSTVGRYLRAHGIGSTVLDLDPEQVDILRRLGLKVYYGDASRLDLLRAAGAERARMIVVAVNEPDKTRRIVDTVRKHFPHLKILVRVDGRALAYELVNEGIEHIYREVFDSSLACADDAYKLLNGGTNPSAIGIPFFRQRDECNLRRLAKYWGDEKNFYEAARKVLEEEEQLLKTGLSARDGDGIPPAGTTPG